MSTEASGEVRKGFYDLHFVPDVPGLASAATTAVMASARDDEIKALWQGGGSWVWRRCSCAWPRS